MDVTKPYKFIGFGAMDVTKPYKFIGFGAMEVTPNMAEVFSPGGPAQRSPRDLWGSPELLSLEDLTFGFRGRGGGIGWAPSVLPGQRHILILTLLPSGPATWACNVAPRWPWLRSQDCQQDSPHRRLLLLKRGMGKNAEEDER